MLEHLLAAHRQRHKGKQVAAQTTGFAVTWSLLVAACVPRLPMTVGVVTMISTETMVRRVGVQPMVTAGTAGRHSAGSSGSHARCRTAPRHRTSRQSALAAVVGMSVMICNDGWPLSLW